MNAPLWIEKKLQEKLKQGNYRRLKINNLNFANNFASNDYLALSTNTEVLAEFNNLKNAGTCASRLVVGELKENSQLETDLTNYLNFESTLVYSSGFLANLGLISSLIRREDVVFSDKQIHSSLIEGVRLSGATHFRFEHNNLEHLESFLKKENLKRKNNQNYFIIVESLYSMSGDSPDILELSNLSLKYNSLLIVDEAHAIGVFKNGISKNISRNNLILTATLSKAFGTYGGIVSGPKWLKEFLINFSRPFIYNTALPLAITKASIKSLDIIKSKDDLGDNLLNNAKYFKNNLKVDTVSNSQIIPVYIGDSEKSIQLAKNLSDLGFEVAAIRPPTAEKAMLRISITLHHTREKLLMFSRLINELI